jgi:hypothetical protein
LVILFFFWTLDFHSCYKQTKFGFVFEAFVPPTIWEKKRILYEIFHKSFNFVFEKSTYFYGESLPNTPNYFFEKTTFFTKSFPNSNFFAYCIHILFTRNWLKQANFCFWKRRGRRIKICGKNWIFKFFMFTSAVDSSILGFGM